MPAVPDSYQLFVLEEDHRLSEVETTDQEKRLCAANRWLLEKLTTGAITARANWTIDVEGGVDPFVGNGEISKEYWSDVPAGAVHAGRCYISYAESHVEPWSAMDWQIGQFYYRGRMGLSDVRLPIDQFISALRPLLKKPPVAAPDYEFGLKLVEPNGVWTLNWKGERYDIEPRPSMGILRGLKVLAILSRNEGKPISILLLEGTVRAPKDTRPEERAKRNEKEERVNLENAREQITSIADKLFKGEIDVDRAHKDAAKDPKKVVAKTAPTLDLDAPYQNVRRSLTKALKRIDKIQGVEGVERYCKARIEKKERSLCWRQAMSQ